MGYFVDTVYDEMIITDYDDPYKLITAAFAAAEIGVFIVPAVPVLSIVGDNDHVRLTAEYARDFKQPYLPALTADTTESVFEVSFAAPVDTLFLGNINFSSFKIDIDGVQQVFSALKNEETGRYDAICYLETPGANIISIIITAQTPIDSASRFNLGAVTGGARQRVDVWYDINKKVNEPVDAETADFQNQVVKSIGRSWHEVDIFSNFLTYDQQQAMEALEAAIDQTEACIIHEYFTEKEILLLVDRDGAMRNSQMEAAYESDALKFYEL